MRFDILLLGLAAPAPYVALGLAITGPRDNILLAPALGCAVAGIVAEVGMMAGLPVGAFAGAAAALAVLVAAWRWKNAGDELRFFARVFLPLYAFAALAGSLSPFPVLGIWGGDWLVLYDTGHAVMTHTMNASPELLSRPPLFGAATAPLWLFADGLIPFQLMSATASAATLCAAAALLRHFRRNAPWIFLAPLCLSPFFLHHNATLWGKFLSAALLIGSFLEAREGRSWWSAFFLAFAVATHDSAIIFVPILVLVHLRRSEGGVNAWKATLSPVMKMAAAGLLVAFPIQAWEIAKFGMAAKVGANPVVSDRLMMSWPLKTLMGIITSLVAWDPVTSIVRWASSPLRFTRDKAAREIFWLLGSWVSTMAGTFLGLFYPFLRQRLWPSDRPPADLQAWLIVLSIPLVAANALTPFYGAWGTAQAGLAPLEIGLYVFWVSALPQDERAAHRALRRASLYMFSIGTVPWLLLNVPVSLGMRFSSRFTQMMASGSESDYTSLVGAHLDSLGLAGFPLFPAVAALVTLGFVMRARAKVKGSPPPLGS